MDGQPNGQIDVHKKKKINAAVSCLCQSKVE